MTVYGLAAAAALLGVSDDTLRRWADSGRFPTTRTDEGHAGVEGRVLAGLARELADLPERPEDASPHRTSARNELRGIVTAVTKDTVMAQVDLCCGPYRVVSLMSREASDALQLEPGMLAVASIKATNVVVAVPA